MDDTVGMKASTAKHPKKRSEDVRRGRLLRALRERREWSPTAAAFRCEMSESSWLKFESGLRALTDSAVMKIARGTGESVESLKRELEYSPLARTA